jgi:hypothetical protein
MLVDRKLLMTSKRKLFFKENNIMLKTKINLLQLFSLLIPLLFMYYFIKNSIIVYKITLNIYMIKKDLLL